MSIRVIKLGGSLLDWSEWPSRFRRWLAAQAPAANVLIVGGGPVVEGLRTLDRVHRLSVEASHWLAIDALRVTARLAQALLPEAVVIERLEPLESQLAILDVAPFLRAEQGSAAALPSGWDITSDSIAAHVARAVAASELVLLKSALPSWHANGQPQLAGYVDAHFAVAARGLVVRAVHLRAFDFPEIRL